MRASRSATCACSLAELCDALLLRFQQPFVQLLEAMAGACHVRVKLARLTAEMILQGFDGF